MLTPLAQSHQKGQLGRGHRHHYEWGASHFHMAMLTPLAQGHQKGQLRGTTGQGCQVWLGQAEL